MPENRDGLLLLINEQVVDSCHQIRESIPNGQDLLLQFANGGDVLGFLADSPEVRVEDLVQGFDLPVTAGVVVFATTAIIVCNLVVDVLYAWIDPRIRLE